VEKKEPHQRVRKGGRGGVHRESALNNQECIFRNLGKVLGEKGSHPTSKFFIKSLEDPPKKTKKSDTESEEGDGKSLQAL